MRILIAEDHDLILEGLKVVLRRLGADVTIRTSADFADALEAAKRDDFELVLLDRGLPGMNGIAGVGVFRRVTGSAWLSRPFNPNSNINTKDNYNANV